MTDDTEDRIGAGGDASLETRLIHDGESAGSSAVPIHQSNTFEGLYVRMRNPTVEALEEKVRSLEGAAATVAFGSGMAAVSHTLLGLLRPGDRLVAHRSVFIGIHTLLTDYVAELGIEVARVDLTDPAEMDRALATPTRLVYFETLSNPWLEAVDAPAVIAAAHGAGARVAIDNTLLTPYLWRPLDHGADLVIHSATKYLSGHGDALAGLVSVADPEIADVVRKARRLLGGFLSPQNAFLVMRGLKTLPLRVDRHCRNAQRLAEYLASHPRVRRVLYPGLPTAPSHRIASSFLDRFGGLVSFETHEPFDWRRFSAALRWCTAGMSFGEVGSRIQQEGPIRLSVGLEDADDLVADLDRAFAAADG